MSVLAAGGSLTGAERERIAKAMATVALSLTTVAQGPQVTRADPENGVPPWGMSCNRGRRHSREQSSGSR